jgi:Ca-activated chloride channel family protein
LTLADVNGKPVQAFVGAVEKSVVHYGKSTGFFSERMLARGPSYLSAAVLYENLVVEAAANPQEGALPLVAIYPREGTFWCDHPYSILDAPWVGPAQRKGAELLLKFLRDKPAQQRALALGFRPGDPALAVGAPIDADHGADPKQPQTLLDVPDAATLRALLDMWRHHKRSADVVLVFDKSGSMNGPPLAKAKQGARSFLERLQDDDDVTLLFFDGVVYPAFGPVRLGTARAALLERVEGAFAGGGTALYDAIQDAHDLLSARARKDPSRIHALVLMTDGKDESSKATNFLDVKQRVKAEGDQPVRVFTIAYGKGASDSVLREIAEAGQGMSAAGSLQNIVQVYDEMAAFF